MPKAGASGSLLRIRAPSASPDSWLAYALFALLCGFTLVTQDGTPFAPLILTAGIFFLLASVFIVPHASLGLPALPVVILLALAGFGLLQILLLPGGLLSFKVEGLLFWFCAAAIAHLSSALFRRPGGVRQFRIWFVWFGTAVCVLDLLQQASGTSRYFWLIASRYPTISGPFSYWNNFAQFVELLLPVTLWEALGNRTPSFPYILCTAIQVGAVVASGSRAGTVLVILELLVCIGLAFWRHRNRKLVWGGLAAIALSLVFIYAAGSETLAGKLRERDKVAVRRSIDRSTLAMIGAKPVTGWGLNTFVPVYRMFALYDDGTFVNRAHNDWLQWAAEGGIPFALGMLWVAGWSIRPALRSGWGTGLLAIYMHAVVDYPFARFGVCGWYFALLGLLATPSMPVKPVD